tara:strand:- start:22374 stop:24824 length:2451 start_codon:yes stop_codon:yes gene_type:complete
MIKNFESYSESDRAELASCSPAFQRYQSLIQKPNPIDPLDQLRISKIKSWSEATLATYFEEHSPKEVCEAWSQTADEYIQKVYDHFNLSAFDMAVCALGKLGAKELNLSSDIDLIFVIRDKPSEELIRASREFAKALSTLSEWGPGFRVDLDLRPGGKGSPLVTNLNHFQTYYWTQAELWERMALVRLRVIAGPKDLSQEISEIRDQYCYRKYLDYSLLEELRRLRPKIHGTAHRNHNDSIIDFKLTPGFIRDIELFVAAHQIMYGGRNLNLRTTSTSKACMALSAFEKSPQLFQQLLEIYWEYRQWENQVQAINDFQTHEVNYENLPKGWEWPQPKDLRKKSDFVDRHISDLLGSAHVKDNMPLSLSDITDEDLLEKGFSKQTVEDVWPTVKSASVLSRQKDVDDQKRSFVIRQFVDEISRSAFDKNLGMKGLKEFLTSIRAKATFYHLLANEEQLIKELSFLFGLSPYLGALFSNRPELMDSFLFNRTDWVSNNLEEALVEMAERKRIAEIRGALAFLTSLKLDPLTQTLTDTADSICVRLLKLLEEDLKFESGLTLLALGKWGGRELGFKSDLDFIFVSEDKPTEVHHKLARRFMSYLRSPTQSGVIYNLDTRLRPQGKGGAIIVQQPFLFEFLDQNAEAWERQAYLKGRWIDSDQNFQAHLPPSKGLSDSDLDQLKKIREKLILPPRSTEFSLKYTQGGLLDIELALQTLILKDNALIEDGSMKSFFKALNLTGSFLETHYLNLRQIEQISRILSLEVDPKLSLDKSFLPLSAKILSVSAEDLLQSTQNSAEKAHKELLKLDPTYIYSGESS